MKNTATKINWKGMECIQLCAGGYTALIAPGIGSNVLRLHDDANGVEFFRWDENNTPEDIRQSAEVWVQQTAQMLRFPEYHDALYICAWHLAGKYSGFCS